MKAINELLLRPIEALLGALDILFRHGTPASLRGGPGAMLVLAAIWFFTSYRFDLMVHPSSFPWPWFGPAYEIAGWTMGLWVFLDRFGDLRRFRQTWLAIAGMSILIWLSGMLVVVAGAIPWGGSIILALLVLRGYGPILHAAFDGRASLVAASLAVIVIGGTGILVKEVLLALAAL